MSEFIDQFSSAVECFSRGDHTGGTNILSALQLAPSRVIAPVLFSHMLTGISAAKACSEGRIADSGGALPYLTALGGGDVAPHVPFDQLGPLGVDVNMAARQHFYAIRLISFAVSRDFSQDWGAAEGCDVLLTCTEAYMNLNVAGLTALPRGAGSQTSSQGHSHDKTLHSLLRPMAVELCSLWAILWKLRTATLAAAQGAAGAASLLQSLGDRLCSMLSRADGPPPNLRPLMCMLANATLEEFGLYTRASAQRCIPISVHESVRGEFSHQILGRLAIAAMVHLSELVSEIDENLAREQAFSGGGGAVSDGLLLSVMTLCSLTAFLDTLLQWRLSDFNVSLLFLAGASAAVGGGIGSAPEILTIKQENWRPLLESGECFGDSVFNTLRRALSTTVGLAIASDTTRGQPCGLPHERLAVAKTNLFSILVQLCSVNCLLWEEAPQSRAVYGGRAWTACLNTLEQYQPFVTQGCAFNSLQNDTTRELPWECLSSCTLAMSRVITAIGTEDAVFHHPNGFCAVFAAPLRQLTLGIVAAIVNEEARIASTTSQHRPSGGGNGPAYCSGEGDDGNGASAMDALLDSLDHLLVTWTEIVRTGLTDNTNRIRFDASEIGALAEGAASVLCAFVDAKVGLHSSQGGVIADDGSERPESRHAIEYGNRCITVMAYIARERPEETCRFLQGHLSNLVNLYFGSYVDRGQSPPMPLHEALWYVITVIGEYIADATTGESPSIPAQFTAMCLRCENQFPDDPQSQFACNPLISLCCDVFSLAQRCSQLPNALSDSLISPGVCQALLDALVRYTSTYVLPNPISQSEAIETFDNAFTGGQDVVSLVVAFADVCSRSQWHDPLVCASVAKTFDTLARLPGDEAFWSCLTRMPPNTNTAATPFDQLCALFSASGPASGTMLPGKVRGSLAGLLIAITLGSSKAVLDLDDPQAAQGTPLFFTLNNLCTIMSADANAGGGGQCSEPLADTFAVMVSGLTTRQSVDCAKQAGVFRLARLICDCAASVAGTDRRPLIAAVRMLDAVVQLVGCVIDGATFIELVQLALEVSRYVGQCQQQFAAAVDADDDLADLLTATANLVFAVASWGLVDFSTDAVDHQRNTLVAELSVRGLLSILVFLNEQTVLLPDLRDAVFRLLKEVSATYTASMLSISQEESTTVLRAVHFALTSSIPDLVQSAAAVMQSIAAFVARRRQQSGDASLLPLVQQFLEATVQLTMTSVVDPTSLGTISGALFDVFKALSPEVGGQAFYTFGQSMQAPPVVMAAIEVFCENLRGIDFESNRRGIRSFFGAAVERMVNATQGARLV